ncbi:MAG: DUF3466 family protein, partial [Verrucomicrobiales bacterium]|nr:DUF3466 family protein [Verrucomicrobiales bacterium]
MVLASPASTAQYFVTEVPAGEGCCSGASGISASGVVVGHANNVAVLMDSTGVHDLGVGGISSSALAISDTGGIIGVSSARIGGFLIQEGAQVDLSIHGYSRINVLALNDSGTVVGSTPSGLFFQHAFSLESGVLTDLGTLGGDFSRATGINNLGHIVGQASDSGGVSRAFFYDENGMHDLGGLRDGYAIAQAINDVGQVVGQAASAEDASRLVPVLFQGGVVLEIPAIAGAPGSYAPRAINNRGVVVGEASTAALGQRAWIHSGGVTLDLNSLLPESSGWYLSTAQDINDAGQIVGTGFLNGRSRGFVLTPVPEPPAGTTAVVSMLGLWSLLRWRGRTRETRLG